MVEITARVAVEAVEGIVISDRLDGAANHLLEIDVSFGRNFPGDDDQAGGGERFTGDAAGGIFYQAGVENGIGNLVGDLIGMAFGHRFGGKQNSVLCCQVLGLLIAVSRCSRPRDLAGP